MRVHALIRRASVVGVAVAGVFLTAVGPAQAVEPGLKSSAAEEVCWLDADTDVLRCFTDQAEFEDAVAVQTGGPLLEATSSPTKAARLAEIQPLATYVLATFYKDANFSGGSLNITTSQSAMCSGYLYNGNLTGSWDNAVSSVQSYGDCHTALWSGANQTGAEYGPLYSSANMNSEVNDTASSYRIVHY